MRRLGGVSGAAELELQRFELVSTAAGRYADPASVDFGGALEVEAPATVAAALARVQRLDLEHPPALDAQDHWFRARLPAELPAGPHDLVLEGLATLADVWLDGEHLLRSENMFARHELELAAPARPGSELVLRFRALAPELAKRRPRPRWRTRIVDAQQLRWIRTSLIGRTPGFCPDLPAVGPYRPVRLRSRPRHGLRSAQVRVRTLGQGGEVQVTLGVADAASAAALAGAELVLEGAAGQGRCALHVEVEARGSAREQNSGASALQLVGTLRLERVECWWPHTHGAQPRSRLSVQLPSGERLALGAVGFRELAVDRDRDGDGFGLVINGVPLFARGACWTTDDLLTLSARDARRTLEQARAAGMNMIRVGGTTAYESPEFYELCDELGILVFQDFMFANMDYPAEDPGFRGEVEREVRDLLADLGPRPCLAVLCGGSEVEQQIAMLGMPREYLESSLFRQLLPALCAELAPGVPYVTSSPSGGEQPFYANAGVTHYYGVGAYLRPLEDARRAGVRFAAECLAFANVPCRASVEGFLRDLEMPFHHPRWKQRVPRDRGVGWDFEDVRDHYLGALYQVTPRLLRYAEPERYLALSQAVVGEVMRATYDEWRSARSRCRGALVFWLKDFWDGAGWGVIDASGRPKSAYYYLKRCLAPLALACTDEGVNGVALHVVHEGAEELRAELRVRLFRAGEVVVAEARQALQLSPRSTRALSVEGLLGRFVDSAYAYRFGPPGHDLIVAELALVGEDAAGREPGAVRARAFHFPLGHARAQELDLGLCARFEEIAGQPHVRVQTRRFAQGVVLDVPGYLPDDNWFHLEPGGERLIGLAPEPGSPAPLRGELSALNALQPHAIARA
jgi:beta-mannosidase